MSHSDRIAAVAHARTGDEMSDVSNGVRRRTVAAAVWAAPVVVAAGAAPMAAASGMNLWDLHVVLDDGGDLAFGERTMIRVRPRAWTGSDPGTAIVDLAVRVQVEAGLAVRVADVTVVPGNAAWVVVPDGDGVLIAHRAGVTTPQYAEDTDLLLAVEVENVSASAQRVSARIDETAGATDAAGARAVLVTGDSQSIRLDPDPARAAVIEWGFAADPYADEDGTIHGAPVAAGEIFTLRHRMKNIGPQPAPAGMRFVIESGVVDGGEDEGDEPPQAPLTLAQWGELLDGTAGSSGSSAGFAVTAALTAKDPFDIDPTIVSYGVQLTRGLAVGESVELVLRFARGAERYFDSTMPRFTASVPLVGSDTSATIVPRAIGSYEARVPFTD